MQAEYFGGGQRLERTHNSAVPQCKCKRYIIGTGRLQPVTVITTQHAAKYTSALCVLAAFHDNGFLCTTFAHKHTRQFPSNSSHNSVLHFFSLHQLSDTQQWAVTLEEKQNSRERELGFGRKAARSTAKKRYRKCEGKRELFKEKVRRVRA